MMASDRSILILGLTLSIFTSAIAVPVPWPSEPANVDGHGNDKADLPVAQLEKLKATVPDSKVPATAADIKPNGHIEYHHLDSVKTNGELVSRLEQHAVADVVAGEKPHVHAQAQLDVPSEGVHQVLVQEGDHIAIQEATAPPAPGDEQKEVPKVFHGAARLVQAGSATAPPPGTHVAVRRAFNADITKETKHNMDHFYPYTGIQYSPLDMAEYVFWTGDERGVTIAVEEFLQEGIMTKEEAIAFLQEIKFNVEYLRTHFSQSVKSAEENAQQEKIRSLMEQGKEGYQYRVPAYLQSFPFGNSPDIIKTIANKNWELSNSLTPSISALPMMTDMRREQVKRSYPDAMLQTNIINTSDYDRDGNIVTEEEYEEMMDKLKASDNQYTQYTMEEIIYQLAKMMFTQSMTRDPREAHAAIKRFLVFLEMEAERGQLSRTIEKKILDVMVAALSDAIGDHPEVLQAREGIGSVNQGNKIMHQFLESSVAEPSMSRAILSAYKEEILKEQNMHKLAFPERN